MTDDQRPAIAQAVVDDAVLPAARHLTGDGAHDLLSTVAGAAGGRLLAWRSLQVQYRPGSDLLVRYHARMEREGVGPVDESIVAATNASGVHHRFPSALPLLATAPDGRGGEVDLEVAVWRWPFDPELVGLASAVTTRHVAELLDTDPSSIALEAVAYRPAERAVVRALTPAGVRYLKVVPPARTSALVRRHLALTEAGVPAPVVVAVDETAGVVALAELAGTSLRDEFKQGSGPWPGAEEYLSLAEAMARVEGLEPSGRHGLVTDGIGHTRLLSSIVPDRGELLDEVVDELRAAVERSVARRGTIVHGDLYEAQLHVEGARIVGVLDVDDVGPGDAVDDPANVLAHLMYRSATTTDPRQRDRLRHHSAILHRDLDRHHVDRGVDDLDLVTGAALLGLATGPFRVQHDDWPASVRGLIDTAAGLVLGEAAARGT